MTSFVYIATEADNVDDPVKIGVTVDVRVKKRST